MKQFRAHLKREETSSLDAIASKGSTNLFFSARTLALGTSKRQFGQW